MNMSWFESIIFGLFSGLTEFLPVSSSAHQQIMMHLFGVDVRDPVRDFFIHIAMLVAVVTSCKSFFDIIKRRRYGKYHSNQPFIQELRRGEGGAGPFVLREEGGVVRLSWA